MAKYRCYISEGAVVFEDVETHEEVDYIDEWNLNELKEILKNFYRHGKQGLDIDFE